MGVNLTNYDHALKTLWPNNRIRNLVYTDNPLLAMIPKDEDFGGANMVVATQYGDSQGRSATFATAQANKGNLSGAKFLITRAKDYGLGSIDGETLEASEKDSYAMASAFDREMKSVGNSLKRSLAISMYRSGTGSIGQISAGSNTATATITLLNINDVTNFEVGQVLTAHATDGAAARVGTTTLTGIDRDLGTLTVTTAWTTGIAAAAASDFLVQSGDVNLKIKGLAAWIPSTAPSATSFFGVDRTVDVTRLGGKRIDVSALNPEEGLVTAAASLGREGGSPSHLFVNYVDFKNYEISLGSKVNYVDMSVGEIGFRGIKVNGPKGFITVLPDQNCPSAKGYMLQLDTWKLHSLGPAPKLLNKDGNRVLREASSDGIEFRLGYYAQMSCDAPGWNAVLTLPS